MRRPHVYERSVPRVRREPFREPASGFTDDGSRAATPLIGLHHVQVAMPPGRESEARAFYAGLLGVPEVTKPPRLAARGGCWFQSATLRIHLGVEADFRPARKAHPAFVVHDLAAIVESLAAAGHPSFRDEEPLEGYDRAFVDDPFGNRIELMQPFARREGSPQPGSDGSEPVPG